MHRRVFWVVVLCCSLPATADPSIDFFEQKVRPILVERCLECHGPKKQESSLRLDHGSFVQKGGETGPVVVPQKPAESRLVTAIGYTDVDLQMPPAGKLTQTQIDSLSEWVKQGAVWPDEPIPSESKAAPVFDLAKRRESHWCWKPIRRPTLPISKNPADCAVDRFIDVKLTQSGLKPASPADKGRLLRRVSFDLTGLPPSTEELDAFLADRTNTAFEKVVDRLLASPRFGERWARHWMDLVRFAETFGHEFDYPIEGAFEYRDYLIRAFNSDLPYDRFVTEHIAGDLLQPPRRHPTEGFNESILGTSFWFFHEQTHAPVDVRQHHADRLDNQIDTMGKTFLGLTLGCARCHDHKFDAISTKDVYSLWGCLVSSRTQSFELDPQGRRDKAAVQVRRLRAEIDGAINAKLPRSSAESAQWFSQYLLGAREAMIGRPKPGESADAGSSRSAAVVAQERGLDPAALGRWIAALQSQETRKPSHPLFAWSKTAAAPDEAGSHFSHHRQQALAQWSEQDRLRKDSISKTILFEDFSRPEFGGWRATGWSFGEGPTAPGNWNLEGKSPTPFLPGVVHSGRTAEKLPGVLRSKSFIIEKSNVLYRLAGKGGKVRLIVDGYIMDQFTPLLFGGLKFDVEHPKLTWHVQSGDLSRYLGHRAHIEIHDDGAGWAAVDEIRFSDAPTPPVDSPSVTAGQLLTDSHIDDSFDLAAAYGEAWSKSLADWRDPSAQPADVELLHWAASERLLEGSLVDLASAKTLLDELVKDLPAPRRVTAITDGAGVDQPVYIRGKHQQPGEITPRRFLEAIDGSQRSAFSADSSGRMQLGHRLVAMENPLTARVWVNRVWHHLFGRGIVASVDNFGVQGQLPTHPELLDWLADEFRKEGAWSTKGLIRRIVLSRAYQRSVNSDDPILQKNDPRNLLLSHANLRRLEGEALRDAMLLVSGRLSPTMYGPSVPTYLTSFMEGRGRPQGGPLDGAGRRSVYQIVQRNFLSPMMLAFDTPIPFQTVGQRTVSNVPAQSLILMNDPLVVDLSKSWAANVIKNQQRSTEDRVESMARSAFGRSATGEEIEQAKKFLEEQRRLLGLSGSSAVDDLRAWADLCHAFFNAKEFIYLQ